MSLRLFIKEIAQKGFVFASIFSGLIMTTLFISGFCLIVSALVSFFRQFFSGTHHLAVHETVSEVLHGLEFMFLAPLPSIVFLSLCRYLISFYKASRGDTILEADRNRWAGQVHSVKALVMGLMGATIATDLMSKALIKITLDEAIAEIIIMLMIVTFWLALDIRSRHSSAASKSQELP